MFKPASTFPFPWFSSFIPPRNLVADAANELATPSIETLVRGVYSFACD